VKPQLFGRGLGLMAMAIAMWMSSARPSYADVHDSLPDILSTWVDMQEDPSPPWELAWLRYEAAQSSWLDPTLYAGRSPEQKAHQIDATLRDSAVSFPIQMNLLTTFENGWGTDLAAVNEGLRREFGQVPLVELYVAFSMAPAKLAVGELGGKPSMCVNARRLLPYRSTATRVLLARYLSEWVITRWQRSSPAAMADRLHLEGMAVWAAGRALPGVADEDLLDISKAQMRQLEMGRARYAALVLAGLADNDRESAKRLFSAEPPAGWPPATGPYIGLLVTRAVAQELGQANLVNMSHATFVARAKDVLAKLAAVPS
jgi:hypothetical protein